MSYTRSVDGFSVDEDRCRISGQIHVDPEDAGTFHVGSDVMIVMLARVTGPTFKESKGDITRINVLKPLEMRAIEEGEFRDIVTTKLGFDYADLGDDVLKEENAEPEIEFVEVPAEKPEVIEFPTGVVEDPSLRETQMDNGREFPEESFVLSKDDDDPLAEFIQAAEGEKRTPVGGGKFAEGEEAERLRRFLDE